MNIQSSLSATDRIDKNILLVLMGPNTVYNPIFEIPFFIDFFSDENHTNSILICHDHGSTYELLWEIFIANLINMAKNIGVAEIFPVTLFADGILRDNASYDTAPNFPVIDLSSSSHPTDSGINEVVLSEATAAAGGPLVTAFGWEVVGQGSAYSYVDKNDNKRDDVDDSIDISAISPIISQLVNIPNIPDSLLKLPLYSPFIPVVFMAKELANSRVFVSSDGSLFNNELIKERDNLQFGINIIDWLTYAGIDNKDDWIIAFDEAHIRPEYSNDLTSAGIFGFILQYIVHLSTNPITAWIYPVLAIYTLRKYLPKKDEDEEKRKAAEAEKKEEKEKFRTSSFFAQKIGWYKEKNRYGKALILLYRRVERKLHAQIGGEKITTQRVTDWITAKEAGGKVSKQKIKRIAKFMDRMLNIKEGRGRGSKVRSPEEFESLFLEMSWVMKNI
jgi:hypothetical protein